LTISSRFDCVNFAEERDEVILVGEEPRVGRTESETRGRSRRRLESEGSRRDELGLTLREGRRQVRKLRESLVSSFVALRERSRFVVDRRRGFRKNRVILLLRG
jgi:hypothetical protein